MKSLYHRRHENVINTTIVDAKPLNLEDLSLHAIMISTYSRQYITANIFKVSHIGEYSFI